MDFVQNLSISFGSFDTQTWFIALGILALIVGLFTIALLFHWWKYTFTGDVVVWPMALLYIVGVAILLGGATFELLTLLGI